MPIVPIVPIVPSLPKTALTKQAPVNKSPVACIAGSLHTEALVARDALLDQDRAAISPKPQ